MICRCDADTTKHGPKERMIRAGKNRLSRRVFHTRIRDDAVFWHWEDQGWRIADAERRPR